MAASIPRGRVLTGPRRRTSGRPARLWNVPTSGPNAIGCARDRQGSLPVPPSGRTHPTYSVAASYVHVRTSVPFPGPITAGGRWRSLNSMRSFVPHRPDRRQWLLVDLPVACAIAAALVFGNIEAAKGQLEARSLDWFGYGLLAGSGLVIALVRTFPPVAMAVTVPAHILYIALGYPEGAEWAAALIAIGGVTAAGYRRLAYGVGLGLMLWMIGQRMAGGGDSLFSAETLLAIIGISSALFAGEWVRTRRDYVESTIQRAELAERTKEEEARYRVNEERLRIAREMHDVLAHSLASINVQAGVTLHVLKKHPSQAEEALTSIKAASAEALRELRSTLGALREGATPASKLADVDALIEPARSAGLSVAFRNNGDAYALPSDVDLAAYRILQESITNAIRYAGPATLTISLDYRPDRLLVCVEDDGRGPGPTPARDGTGSGITGMRERTYALGGTFDAGPGAGGGFAVRAMLPTNGALS
jgi:signal transduction histidine kinase